MFNSMCDQLKSMDTYDWMPASVRGGSYGEMTPLEFCHIISPIDIILTKILLHAMIVPVLILILITLFGKDKEDAKWFVLHTAIINLILGLLWEITLINMESGNDGVCKYMIMYIIGVSINSIFPLAFTRFFYMYFPYTYEEVFTKKTMVPIMLVYDGIIIGLYAMSPFTTHYICCIVNVSLLIGTIICISFVIRRIKKMMLMAEGSKLDTMNDLRKAIFVCIFQSSVISLHIASRVYTQTYNGLIGYEIVKPEYGYVDSTRTTKKIYPIQVANIPDSRLLFFVYLLLDNWRYTLFQLYVLIDTIMTLVILKTYRRTLTTLFFNIWDPMVMFLCGKKYKRRTSDSTFQLYKKRPSLNQWTG